MSEIPQEMQLPQDQELTSDSDLINKPYTVLEATWGLTLIIFIFGVNTAVLWVLSRSRDLWKPRHLWMGCLCITDLFVGGHKGLELLLLVWPQKELCVIQRATLGIPYIVNILILTLLSLDRFTAVRYPFFYSSSVSNKHVVVGFLLVLMAGTSLSIPSIIMGLQHSHCRTQSLQLIYLTIILAICSVLNLFFNSAVLRIARKQLNAIYAQEPSLMGQRKVSVVCSNCGFKNETFVNTLLPVPLPLPSHMQNGTGNHGHRNCSEKLPLIPSKGTVTCSNGPGGTMLPFTDAVVLGRLDLDHACDYHKCNEGLDIEIHENNDDDYQTTHLMDDTSGPLVKAASLPTISETVNVPVSVVVQPDPSMPPSVIVGSLPRETDFGIRVTSMSKLDDVNEDRVSEQTLPNSNSVQFPTLPRSRSLMACQTQRIIPSLTSAPKLQILRNLHFAKTHMFHVGRLFPSIRFAKTVIFIMIPLWVFILPIVTIIPLHRACEDGRASELNCDLVDILWRYLIVHMRSILPLQAVLDTLIYAIGSKEFRNALVKLIKKHATPV